MNPDHNLNPGTLPQPVPFSTAPTQRRSREETLTRTSALAVSQRPDPPDLVVEVYELDGSGGRGPGPKVGCCGPAETVAAWMRAYADLLAPATRVSYHGIHPTHRNDETDR